MAQTHEINDDSPPLEPYQLILQYTLQNLLCDIARVNGREAFAASATSTPTDPSLSRKHLQDRIHVPEALDDDLATEPT